MKRYFIPFILLITVLLLGACNQKEIDERLAQLKQDVTELEAKVSALNENVANLSSLISALETNNHITKIEPWSLLDMSGYLISFSSGTTLRLRNGTNGVPPIVGVRYNEDYDAYYWTIQLGPDGSVVWMTDDTGRRVRATNWVPQLKIEDGIWWYSFDGTYWNKTGWGEAQGQAGKAFFSSVDTSNPYYVTFLLADNSRFQLPTQQAFDELNQQCSDINGLFKTYTELVHQTDSSIFVKSVVDFEEDGVTGTRITFENGKVISIRNGFNNRDSLILSAKAYSDGKYYWVFRNRIEDEFQWLRYQGQMICVTQENITPHIGITEKNGQLYFTIAYGEGPAELMLDASGNPIVATGKLVPDFFSNVDISDPSCLILTLADGSVVRIPRTRFYTPTITTSARTDYLEAETSYTYHLLAFVSDTLQQKTPCVDYTDYQRVSNTKIEAIAVDDGYIDGIKVVEMTIDTTYASVRGIVAYNFIFDVQFPTGPLSEWNTAIPSRYAIFLSWPNKSIMKVVSFNRAILAKEVKLSDTTLELTVGKTATLKATVTPSNTTDQLIWKSSNEKVATVSDKGVVTAKAVGNCTITASAGRRSASCAVTVKASTP